MTYLQFRLCYFLCRKTKKKKRFTIFVMFSYIENSFSASQIGDNFADPNNLYNVFQETRSPSARDAITGNIMEPGSSNLDRAARGLVGMPLVATSNIDYLRPLFSNMDIEQIECGDIDYQKCGDRKNPLTYASTHPSLQNTADAKNKDLNCAFNLIDESKIQQCRGFTTDAQVASAQKDARRLF